MSAIYSFAMGLFRDEDYVPRRVSRFRSIAARILLVEQWGFLFPIATVAYFTGNSIPSILAVGTASAALSTWAYFAHGARLTTRITICIGMLMDVLLLIYALSGTGSWQMDGGHMWVFAVWSHCLALLCWRSLIVSGFLGVAHHFILVYLLPFWVFPDGANLGRVWLHGAVVILQMVAFTPIVILINRMLRNAEDLEHRLEQSTQLAQSASQEKSNFLSGMSHELRTPLNAIIGFSEVMRGELFGPLSARYKQYAADIHWSAQHLTKVIGNILDLAKVSEGRMEIADDVIDPAILCRDVVGMCQPLAATNRNQLRLEIDGLPKQFGTDGTRLQQILINLLGNACKYTNDGEIAMRARPILTGIVFEVSDTGIGIAEPDQARIFQMFSQATSQVSRPHGGTGIGLALSKEFAELLGGTLTVQSKPGQGSTFILCLPNRSTAYATKDQRDTGSIEPLRKAS